jgi:hypothetical protein
VGGGLYVRLYRFRQTHGTFQKATRCPSHESKRSPSPIHFCVPDRLRRTTHLLFITIRQLLTVFLIAHNVFRPCHSFFPDELVVCPYLRAPAATICRPTIFSPTPPETLDPLRTGEYSEISNQKQATTAGFATHNNNPINVQGPLCWALLLLVLSTLTQSVPLLPSPTFVHSFAVGQHQSAWSHRQRKHVSRTCDIYL